MTTEEKLAQIESLAKNTRAQAEEIFAEYDEINNPDFEDQETMISADAADNIASQILDIINQK